MSKRTRTSEDRKVLRRYEAGEFVSVAPSRTESNRFRNAAKATVSKDRRVNIRLSTPVLMDIQARAAEEGLPYQTLIASVLYKFVTGRLVEQPSRLTPRSGRRAA